VGHAHRAEARCHEFPSDPAPSVAQYHRALARRHRRQSGAPPDVCTQDPMAATQPTRRRRQPMRPIQPENFGYEQARHLLWRAGFGGTAGQIQTLVSWGPERAVDYLLEVEKVEYDQPA